MTPPPDRAPSSRSGGVVSLLGSRPGAPERGDALARSDHSRLDRIFRPEGDADPQKAVRVCADVCRELLQDFAPALVFLEPPQRLRAQCLLAYAHTLFDFARQQGIEGERLAEINRWEFSLELALAGEPPRQPIFLRIAAEESRQPWPLEAFLALGQTARQGIGGRSPVDPRQAEARRQRIARAVYLSLFGDEPPETLTDLGATLIRVRGLQNLGAALRFGQHDLIPQRQVAKAAEPSMRARDLAREVRQECKTLRESLLQPRRSQETLSPPARRTVRYLSLAALRLLSRIETLGEGVLESVPRLAIHTRIGLLLRARWM